MQFWTHESLFIGTFRLGGSGHRHFPCGTVWKYRLSVWHLNLGFHFTGTDHLIAVWLFCLDCSDPRQGTQNESLVRTNIFSWLASESSPSLYWKKMIRMLKLTSDQTSCARSRLWSEPSVLKSDYDQTQVRSKWLWSDPSATEATYDQTFRTKLTSDQTKTRPCCRLWRLWSDRPDRIDLWSDRNQTMVQSIVRSNHFPDPVISIREHTCVSSIGSDHSSFWVWT